ncbi:MAG: DUF452 family protein [Muribaculaceae bacterium]|nr:DUF452 family protein [Muribaculaceae bacterium]
MKLQFISHSPDNHRLILIFAGWGTTPELYVGATRTGWDTLVAYDFDDFDFPTDIVGQYSTIYLFAWSLGVYAAHRALTDVSTTSAFAINGTLTPVSDTEGIPVDIFSATAATLSLRNLTKFRLRMAGSREALEQLELRLPSTPDIDMLRRQLEFVASDSKNNQTDNSIPWRRVYIGNDDRIFPSSAQHTAWSHNYPEVEIINLKAPHFIELSKIVHSVIPDTERVAHRFHKALPTYDKAAEAQRLIARRLADMAVKAAPKSRSLRVLEIGVGSGLFSRMYTVSLPIKSITYLDLYPIPQLNLAPEEYYMQADAEKWMEECTEQFDLIVSASTIQWFSHQARFFANASRCLTPDGALVCSTFLPGNLSELDTLRPSPMLYLTFAKLEAALQRNFTDVTIETQDIPLLFASPREALLHLKATGVGGSAAVSSSGASLLRALTPPAGQPVTLTYRPAWFTARNRNKYE